MDSIYLFNADSINGNSQSLSDYKGKVVLIVNTASLCGLTPQYEGLEALYKKYKDQDFVILGFPCDQFGHQEPGSEKEIKEFCSARFAISFPLFAKIDVNGETAHPLFKFLKNNSPGFLGTEAIKWNFTKFLVDKSGKVIQRFAPTTTPEDIEKDIIKLI